MSKLEKLIAKREALSKEVEGNALFLDRVNGKGTLIMKAVSPCGETDGIAFTPKDLGLELKVLAPIEEHQASLKAKLAKVQKKLDALETLMD